jgi:signal transduction histidine kinase
MIRDYAHALMEHGREGVALVEVDTHLIRDANRVLAEMAGRPLEQIIGQPCHAIFNDLDFPCAMSDCPVGQVREGQAQAEALHVHDGQPPLHVRAVRLDEGHALLFCSRQADFFHQAEELEALQYISSLVHRTLSIDEVLHTILTVVTAHTGLGFHRAFIFLLNGAEDALRGTYAVGPADAAEAARIWGEIQHQNLSLMDLLRKFKREEFAQAPIARIVRGVTVPLGDRRDVLVWAYLQGIIVNLTTDTLPPDLTFGGLDALGSRRCVIIPLASALGHLGVLVADNTFSGTVIDEKRVKSLAVFAAEATTALVNSLMFENLKEKSGALESALRSLKESQEKLMLAERLSTIGQLSAQIAHEIRNPLVSIGMLARRLRRMKGLAPEEVEKVEEMEQEVHRLERLLNDLLDFSAQPQPKPKPLRIQEVLRSILILMEDEFLRRGIHVSTYVQEPLPPALADPDQMRHVFLNLFRNAMNILPHGGKVAVEAVSPDPGWIRVSITDNGPGIPEGLQERIFTPFFSTSSVGTGLGLAIAARIIQDHGGHINVDSAPGKGTTFHVELKAATEGTDAQ